MGTVQSGVSTWVLTVALSAAATLSRTLSTRVLVRPAVSQNAGGSLVTGADWTEDVNRK